MRISDWSSDVCSSDLRMAEQAGHFTLQDVIDGITEKMIRRHPHVFGEGTDRKDGHAQWEAIKAAERAEKEPDQSALAGVAIALPGIGRASCRERVCTYV